MRTTERTFATALAPSGKTESHLFTALTAQVKSVLTALRNRRALMALSDLEDSHLRDIGLNARDVDRALENAGLLQDPFSLLPRQIRQRVASSASSGSARMTR